MKVAAIQFRPLFKEKNFNLRRISRLIERAAEAGAKLIVCPELALVGYSFMSVAEAEPLSEVLSLPLENQPKGSSFLAMRLLAEKLNVVIVYGLIEKDPGTGKLYNTQVYIEPNGYWVSYRKINFFGNDYIWCSPGNANPPVVHSDFLGKRVGLLICRDIRDKKSDGWSNFYSKGDADIVAFSTNWGDGGWPSSTWMDFVADHNVTLVVADRYGQEANNNFGEGGSCIITPQGTPERPNGVYCEGLFLERDCIVMADVP